jgi:hypothetical protein
LENQIFGWRNCGMDKTLVAVHKMLGALDAPAYDIGILSDRVSVWSAPVDHSRGRVFWG